MKIALLSGAFLLMTLTNICSAQTNRKYVRVVVLDAYSLEATQQIDLYIRTKTGVLTSRMDRQTGLYLGIFETNNGLTSEDFITWIEELGFTTRCMVDGNHGMGEPIKVLDRFVYWKPEHQNNLEHYEIYHSTYRYRNVRLNGNMGSNTLWNKLHRI